MRVKLKVLKGASAGKQFEVAVPQFVIGRSSGCQLRPQSDAISRKHCVIQMQPEGPTVRDLGSRNGTLVNGAVTQGETRLFTGDELRVGPLYLEVTLLSQDGAVIPREQMAPPASAAPELATSPPAANAQAKAAPREARVDPAQPSAPPQAKSQPTTTAPRATSDSGLIGDWLLESEDPPAKTGLTDVDTRQFVLDETDRIEVPRPEDAPAEAGKPHDKRDKKKKEPGKLPDREVNTATSSREAAEQTLRKMFNRGL